MTVLKEMREIKAGTFRVGQDPCWSENAICKCVYIRGLIGIAVNEAHCISHRQAAWNRVDWKSDYDEWSWLLFEKSDCEIATYINVKLAWWRHWKALTANKFRCLFWKGPCEWAKNRLGVQARWNTHFHFFVAWFSDGSKSSGRVSEQKTSSNLKIKLTSQMSGEFTVNLSVVAFSRRFVIWTFDINYLRGVDCMVH